MRITSRIRSTVIALSILSGLSAVVLDFTLRGTRLDSNVVNHVGILRGSTHQVISNTLYGNRDPRLIANIEAILQGLVDGSSELQLPAASDQSFITLIHELQTNWQTLKASIQLAQAEPTPANRSQVFNQGLDYFKLVEQVGEKSEALSRANNQFVRIIQLILFLFDLLVLSTIWMFLRQTSQTLDESAQSATSLTHQIAVTLEQQEKQLSEQAKSVYETATTMQELGQSSEQARQQAELSAQTTQAALTLATEGNEIVQVNLKGYEAIKENMDQTVQEVDALIHKSEDIKKISSLVAQIAEQTHMLSVNAMVEAVHAGDRGKTFAVVARQVRALAEKSKASAYEIQGMADGVETLLSQTVQAINQGHRTITEGIDLAEQTAESFYRISNSINQVFTHSEQISQRSKQQYTAVQQSISAINSINMGAQESAAGIVQVKQVTESLNETVQQLGNTI